MIGIIIQARMGSTRLPGKILMDFEGKSLLEHILLRLECMKYSVKTVIATSDLEQDNVVEEFCRKHSVDCFRGSEKNVLQRYYECATKYKLEHIVRMTGDNPFPDIEELERLVQYHIKEKNDYSENFTQLPIGVGMEIMSYKALEDSMNNATLPKHFEHVDEYILDNLTFYKHGTLLVNGDKNYPELRLTVDTIQDYEKACYILKNATNNIVSTEELIKLAKDFEQMKEGKK